METNLEDYIKYVDGYFEITVRARDDQNRIAEATLLVKLNPLFPKSFRLMGNSFCRFMLSERHSVFVLFLIHLQLTSSHNSIRLWGLKWTEFLLISPLIIISFLSSDPDSYNTLFVLKKVYSILFERMVDLKTCQMNCVGKLLNYALALFN